MQKNATPPAVQFKGVVKRFDKVVAVKKTDLDIEEVVGETTALPLRLR